MNFTPCSAHLPEATVLPARSRVSSGQFLLVSDDAYVGVGFLKSTESAPVWSLLDGSTLPVDAVTHYAYLPPGKFVCGREVETGLRDEDGELTALPHVLLKNWSWSDPMGWLLFATSLWDHGPMGHCFTEHDDHWEVHISCLGASSNEGLMRSMEENQILWGYHWYSSRAGGHYIFKVDKENHLPEGWKLPAQVRR